LVAACDEVDVGRVDTDEEDIRSEWRHPRLRFDHDVVVVEDQAGEIVGYGLVNNKTPMVEAEADTYAHPAHRAGSLDAWLVDWSLRRAQKMVDQAGAAMDVRAYAIPGEARVAVLEDRGFSRRRVFLRMRAELKLVPPVGAPDGIDIRPYDDARRAEMHDVIETSFADHWGAHRQSLEEWTTRHIERDGFDADLWGMALDDTKVVGALVARAAGEVGWISGLGVLRDWRGRGIGGALLRNAFRVFSARGMPIAELAVDAESPTGATRLYEREGMHLDFSIGTYMLRLRPSPT
jgi:ribosomal protein S18 acetylase RimI-like enzyme